jgi:hypothetical protein
MTIGMQKSAAEMAALSEDIAKDRSVAEAAQRKTTIDVTATNALGHATAPNNVYEQGMGDPRIDDGEAPDAPQNVVVTPRIHGLGVSWDPAPSSHRVKLATIRVTPEGSTSFEVQASTLVAHLVIGLDAGIAHDVEVKFTDAFNDDSFYSAAVEGTPLRTVAEEIDLAELSILGRIQGLLPNENLATIEDATKFGQGVVLGEALAVQDAATFRLWASEAMIESAMIADLSADKITTGTLDAATITIAEGGEVQAGPGCILDWAGLTLGIATSFDTPTVEASYKLGPVGDWGAFHFYENVDIGVDGNFRGCIVRADGIAGAHSGAVVLHATPNGVVDDTAGRLQVLGKPDTGHGKVDIFDDLTIARYCQPFEGFRGGTELLEATFPAGSSSSYPLTRNERPKMVALFWKPTGAVSGWHPLVHSSNNWEITVDVNSVDVVNGSTQSRIITGRVWY